MTAPMLLGAARIATSFDLAGLATSGRAAAVMALDFGKQSAAAFSRGFQSGNNGPQLAPAMSRGFADMERLASASGKRVAESFLGGINAVRSGNPAASFQAATNAMVNVIDTATQAGQALTTFASHFEKIGGLAEFAGTAIGVAGDALATYTDVAGQYLGNIAEIGDVYLQLRRTLAGSTLDMGQVNSLMVATQEIMASGAVDHFDDVSESIGRFARGLQLSGNELKQFVETYASMAELLGTSVSPTNIAGVINAFAPEDEAERAVYNVSEQLTRFTNIIRATGGNAQSMIDSMIRVGPAMRALGFDAGGTALFFGGLLEKGLRGQKLVYGMNQIVEQLHSKVADGSFRDLESAFGSLLKTVQNLQAAGRSDSAIALLSQYTTPANATLLNEAIAKGIISDATEMGRRAREGFDQGLQEQAAETSSLSDVFENLQQELEAAVAPVGLAFNSFIVSGGNKLVDWLDENQVKVAEWAGNIANFFIQGFEYIIGGFSTLLEAFSNYVNPVVEVLVTAFQVVFNAVRLTFDAIGKLSGIPGVGKAFEPFKAVADVMGTMNEGMDKLRQMDLQKPLVNFSNALDNLVAKLPNVRNAITGAVGDYAGRVSIEEAFEVTQKKDPSGRPLFNSDGTPELTQAYGPVDLYQRDAQGNIAVGPDGKAILNTAWQPMLQMTGNTAEWEQVKQNLKTLGIEISYDAMTGVIKNVRALNEEARKIWQDWYETRVKAQADVYVEKVDKNGNPIDPQDMADSLSGGTATVGVEVDEAYLQNWANSMGLTIPGLPMPTGGLPSTVTRPSILKDQEGVQSSPASVYAAAAVAQNFPQITSISGGRRTNTVPNTHDIGQSIDITIPALPGGGLDMALGDKINAWLLQNHQALNIQYTIWRDIGKNVKTGATFREPNHMDHIDVHFNDGGVASITPQGVTINAPAPTPIPGMPTMPTPAATGPAVPQDPQKQQIADYILNKAMSLGYSLEQAKLFLIQAFGESGLNPLANGGNQDGTGDVRGIFQFTPGTWAGRPGDILNPKDNIDQYFKLAEERGLTPQNFTSGAQLGEQVSRGGPFHPSNAAKGDLANAIAGAAPYINNFGGTAIIMPPGSSLPVPAPPVAYPPAPGPVVPPAVYPPAAPVPPPAVYPTPSPVTPPPPSGSPPPPTPPPPAGPVGPDSPAAPSAVEGWQDDATGNYWYYQDVQGNTYFADKKAGAPPPVPENGELRDSANGYWRQLNGVKGYVSGQTYWIFVPNPAEASNAAGTGPAPAGPKPPAGPPKPPEPKEPAGKPFGPGIDEPGDYERSKTAANQEWLKKNFTGKIPAPVTDRMEGVDLVPAPITNRMTVPSFEENPVFHPNWWQQHIEPLFAPGGIINNIGQAYNLPERAIDALSALNDARGVKQIKQALDYLGREFGGWVNVGGFATGGMVGAPKSWEPIDPTDWIDTYNGGKDIGPGILYPGVRAFLGTSGELHLSDPFENAAGGRITGPGGSTSDSILARLSNGEFVVRAAMAAKHRHLLEAINADRMGFSDGGVVDLPNQPGDLMIPAAPGAARIPQSVIDSTPVIKLHPATDLTGHEALGLGFDDGGEVTGLERLQRELLRAAFQGKGGDGAPPPEKSYGIAAQRVTGRRSKEDTRTVGDVLGGDEGDWTQKLSKGVSNVLSGSFWLGKAGIDTDTEGWNEKSHYIFGLSELSQVIGTVAQIGSDQPFQPVDGKFSNRDLVDFFMLPNVLEQTEIIGSDAGIGAKAVSVVALASMVPGLGRLFGRAGRTALDAVRPARNVAEHGIKAADSAALMAVLPTGPVSNKLSELAARQPNVALAREPKTGGASAVPRGPVPDPLLQNFVIAEPNVTPGTYGAGSSAGVAVPPQFADGRPHSIFEIADALNIERGTLAGIDMSGIKGALTPSEYDEAAAAVEVFLGLRGVTDRRIAEAGSLEGLWLPREITAEDLTPPHLVPGTWGHHTRPGPMAYNEPSLGRTVLNTRYFGRNATEDAAKGALEDGTPETLYIQQLIRDGQVAQTALSPQKLSGFDVVGHLATKWSPTPNFNLLSPLQQTLLHELAHNYLDSPLLTKIDFEIAMRTQFVSQLKGELGKRARAQQVRNADGHPLEFDPEIEGLFRRWMVDAKMGGLPRYGLAVNNMPQTADAAFQGLLDMRGPVASLLSRSELPAVAFEDFAVNGYNASPQTLAIVAEMFAGLRQHETVLSALGKHTKGAYDAAAVNLPPLVPGRYGETGFPADVEELALDELQQLADQGIFDDQTPPFAAPVDSDLLADALQALADEQPPGGDATPPFRSSMLQKVGNLAYQGEKGDALRQIFVGQRPSLTEPHGAALDVYGPGIVELPVDRLESYLPKDYLQGSQYRLLDEADELATGLSAPVGLAIDPFSGLLTENKAYVLAARLAGRDTLPVRITELDDLQGVLPPHLAHLGTAQQRALAAAHTLGFHDELYAARVAAANALLLDRLSQAPQIDAFVRFLMTDQPRYTGSHAQHISEQYFWLPDASGGVPRGVQIFDQLVANGRMRDRRKYTVGGPDNPPWDEDPTNPFGRRGTIRPADGKLVTYGGNAHHRAGEIAWINARTTGMAIGPRMMAEAVLNPQTTMANLAPSNVLLAPGRHMAGKFGWEPRRLPRKVIGDSALMDKFRALIPGRPSEDELLFPGYREASGTSGLMRLDLDSQRSALTSMLEEPLPKDLFIPTINTDLNDLASQTWQVAKNFAGSKPHIRRGAALAARGRGRGLTAESAEELEAMLSQYGLGTSRQYMPARLIELLEQQGHTLFAQGVFGDALEKAIYRGLRLTDAQMNALMRKVKSEKGILNFPLSSFIEQRHHAAMFAQNDAWSSARGLDASNRNPVVLELQPGAYAGEISFPMRPEKEKVAQGTFRIVDYRAGAVSRNAPTELFVVLEQLGLLPMMRGLQRADGGEVWGAGSATSDSIPAWLSNGEFVHNAAAVQHYGKDFMHAVNQRKLPKFSDGGDPTAPGITPPVFTPTATAKGRIVGGEDGLPVELQILGDIRLGSGADSPIGRDLPNNPFINPPRGNFEDVMKFVQDFVKYQEEFYKLTVTEPKKLSDEYLENYNKYLADLQRAKDARAELDKAEAAKQQYIAAGGDLALDTDLQQDLEKKNRELNVATEAARQSKKNLEGTLESQAKLDSDREMLQAEGPPVFDPKTGKDDVKPDKYAQKLGVGLIQGLFQGLGFPDVFGKAITDWGIYKLAMGGLGFGMNVAQTAGLLPAPGQAGLGPGVGGGLATGAVQTLLPGVPMPQLPGQNVPQVDPASSVTPAMSGAPAGDPRVPVGTGPPPGPGGGITVNFSGLATREQATQNAGSAMTTIARQGSYFSGNGGPITTMTT